MLISLSWLNEFVDTSGVSVEDLSDAFNDLGLVVEGIEVVGKGLDGIVTAQVKTIRAHPGADKIRLVDVVISADQSEPLQICCGAWNFVEGDVVPLAMLGSTMPDGLKIERRKLRGEWSNGMLCSAWELKLSEDHEGILRLPEGTSLGQPIAEVLGVIADVVFDLSVEANRPDAMSVLGVARDLAPKIKRSLRAPVVKTVISEVAAPAVQTGSITASDLCDRLTTTVIRNVVVAPSPRWVQQRLAVSGMRAINNLVDASNLVMLELGIPSHAFDLDRLAGGRIDVRWASQNEHITTLDGVDRVLSRSSDREALDGVIADGGGVAVGIAAIMGGLTSEVEVDTANLLLEIAHWTPMCIARSSKRLGIRSEASARFERGSDPGAIPLAVARFVDVIRETCPNLSVESHHDVGPNRGAVRKVEVRAERVNLVLGTRLATSEMTALLSPIGFVCSPPEGADRFQVEIPSWRPDATDEINVVEEIGRHFGYRNIERRVLTNVRVGKLTDLQKNRRLIADVLVSNLCNEVWTASFVGPLDLERSGVSTEPVVLANPMAPEESLLRPTLVAGLLRTLGHNASHRSPSQRIFEMGHVFGAPKPDQVVPYERDMLGVALAADGDDASTAIRCLDSLVEALRINPAAIELRSKEIPGLHPTRSARIVGSGTGFNLGSVGEVDPEVARKWGIDRRVGLLVIDVENLCALPTRSELVSVFSRFPSSDVDLAFVVPDPTPAGHISEILRHAGAPLLQTVQLIDVYRGDRVSTGTRGLTYRLRFADPGRTLTDGDVAAVRHSCIGAVEERSAAKLRS